MKLAEALRIRSDYNRRLVQLKTRIKENTKVQEGDEPDESPEALIRELEGLDFKISKMVVEINLINGYATIEIPTFLDDSSSRIVPYNREKKFEDFLQPNEPVPAKKTICEALAERDSLKRRIDMLQFALTSASTASTFNYSKSEIKIVSTIDSVSLQKKIDRLSSCLRVLDIIIQEANWKCEYEETLALAIEAQRRRERVRRFYFF